MLPGRVPVGLAGPLLVDGQHAHGEFWVPLATTEGTLVASYNRGMKLAREAGGITATVIDDAMQRAPAFVFESAREAHAFGIWLTEHFEEVKREAKYWKISLVDPETGEAYRYAVKTDTTYELCATFSLPRDKSMDVFWNHPAGRHCFLVDALDAP